ncbi:hypothetical protein [Prosthecomicrobium sp. N25]|uniref:hypothetical protein n=1 Tax=Prosthecomicrobium sp. N25 TaxID=3129254 RepID=UPI00307888B3
MRSEIDVVKGQEKWLIRLDGIPVHQAASLDEAQRAAASILRVEKRRAAALQDYFG